MLKRRCYGLRSDDEFSRSFEAPSFSRHKDTALLSRSDGAAELSALTLHMLYETRWRGLEGLVSNCCRTMPRSTRVLWPIWATCCRTMGSALYRGALCCQEPSLHKAVEARIACWVAHSGPLDRFMQASVPSCIYLGSFFDPHRTGHTRHHRTARNFGQSVEGVEAIPAPSSTKVGVLPGCFAALR